MDESRTVAFIWNGDSLSETQTFRSYGIREKDVIVSVPSDANDLSKWVTLTRDSESFHDRIASVVDQGTAKEAARLRDFQITRMERKPRTYRKLVMNYERALMESSVVSTPARKSATNLTEMRLEAPSVEPLPIIWDNDSESYEVTTRAIPLVKDDQPITDDRENGTIRS